MSLQLSEQDGLQRGYATPHITRFDSLDSAEVNGLRGFESYPLPLSYSNLTSRTQQR